MRRDVLMVLTVLVALALIGVLITDFWRNGERVDLARQRSAAASGADLAQSATLPRRLNEEVEEIRAPSIRLFTSRPEYAEWYRLNCNEPDIDARSPEGVDFATHQVLTIVWGDKPGPGHSLEVQNIERQTAETLVTVVTRLPRQAEDGATVYPGLSLPVPRQKLTRVVIRGERMRPLSKFADFQPMRGVDLEVEVLPHEPLDRGK